MCFFATEVEFCGQILENGTKRIFPGRLLPLENRPIPQDITSLRGFLGYTNHYHQNVPRNSEHTANLQDKLKVPRILGKKGSKFKVQFSDQDEICFKNLKSSLLEGIRLKFSNPSRPFIIRTDASEKAVGGVLEQLDDNQELPPPGSEEKIKTHPIAFFSRK